jgi:hypothetical protein
LSRRDGLLSGASSGAPLFRLVIVTCSHRAGKNAVSPVQSNRRRNATRLCWIRRWSTDRLIQPRRPVLRRRCATAPPHCGAAR